MDTMVGRKVRDWTGKVGTVMEWKPLGSGMTDTLVKLQDGTKCWFRSSSLKPTDGFGPLPSRREARKEADRVHKQQLKGIAVRWGSGGRESI
jgi:hypothetical protein